MHGTLDEPKFDILRRLRDQADLYFDSGDIIKSGNLGIPIRPESAWPMLDRLECTASVLGNRETHILESAFNAKLAGAKHPLLCANLHRKDGTRPLLPHIILSAQGIRIGIFAVMVPMVTERMATKAASAYLWDPPFKAASEEVAELRPNVDLLICLSHIGHRQDQELAERCPEINVIFGGHSHTVLSQPERVGSTYICQGGSHNRFAGMYEWHSDGTLTGSLIDMKSKP